MSTIGGTTEPGWGRVADALRSHFESGREVGAACAVYVDGKLVVDIWGGIADSRSGRAWAVDTVAVVWSTTKGATALCAHMLVERGALDLDARVSDYWPEFGQRGKADIPVRWFLSHQAGLPVVDTQLTLAEACAWEPVIRALEAQTPLWAAGRRHLYHAHTYGFLIGEVVRRVSGKTLGHFFADEIATPLNLSAWIGSPEEVESRVAHLETPQSPSESVILQELGFDPLTARRIESLRKAAVDDKASVLMRSGTLGGALADVEMDSSGHNSPLLRAAEFPSSNMVADARSIAKMYAATIGVVDGVQLVSGSTVDKMTRIQTASSEPFLDDWPREADQPMALGFWLPSRLMPHLGPRTFGHPGAGGSVGLADRDAGIAFGYVINGMRPYWGNATFVLDAVAACAG